LRHSSASLALVLLILLPTIAIAAPVQAQTEFTIWTDKSAYDIGEAVTVHIQPPMRIGVHLWIVVWTPGGSQVRRDLSSGQDSITFSDATVTSGEYKAELWGSVVVPNATPELLASCNFQVAGGSASPKDVKFQGVVQDVWDDGRDFKISITIILNDPGGCLHVGAVAMVSAGYNRLVIGSPGVGDTVEVYGVIYNCDPNGPGLYVNQNYHYIKKISIPPVCSEGAVNVLETCPDGSTWSHRQVCRNNAWVDEHQTCSAPSTPKTTADRCYLYKALAQSWQDPVTADLLAPILEDLDKDIVISAITDFAPPATANWVSAADHLKQSYDLARGKRTFPYLLPSQDEMELQIAMSQDWNGVYDGIYGVNVPRTAIQQGIPIPQVFWRMYQLCKDEAKYRGQPLDGEIWDQVSCLHGLLCKDDKAAAQKLQEEKALLPTLKAVLSWMRDRLPAAKTDQYRNLMTASIAFLQEETRYLESAG